MLGETRGGIASLRIVATLVLKAKFASYSFLCFVAELFVFGVFLYLAMTLGSRKVMFCAANFVVNEDRLISWRGVIEWVVASHL